MIIDLTKLYKTHAWSHHEYDFYNRNKETHDSTYLLNDIEISNLPENWNVIERFKNSLSNDALDEAMLEIDQDLSRFGVFFDCKLSNIEQLNEILQVDLEKEFDLYLDENSVYTGFFFNGRTGELLYLRKAVNIVKQKEFSLSVEDFEKEVKSVCDKFNISEIPKIPYKPSMADNPFYTFELHKNGECKKLQFEIFTKNRYWFINNYSSDDLIKFISSIKQEQIFSYITHYKIDYKNNKWQLVKIYFCGLDNACEFLKGGDFQVYKRNKCLNEDQLIESLETKLKRLIYA